jgi:hypothetical protein
MATVAGAVSAGLGDKVGTLTPGQGSPGPKLDAGGPAGRAPRGP